MTYSQATATGSTHTHLPSQEAIATMPTMPTMPPILHNLQAVVLATRPHTRSSQASKTGNSHTDTSGPCAGALAAVATTLPPLQSQAKTKPTAGCQTIQRQCCRLQCRRFNPTKPTAALCPEYHTASKTQTLYQQLKKNGLGEMV